MQSANELQRYENWPRGNIKLSASSRTETTVCRHLSKCRLRQPLAEKKVHLAIASTKRISRNHSFWLITFATEPEVGQHLCPLCYFFGSERGSQRWSQLLLQLHAWIIVGGAEEPMQHPAHTNWDEGSFVCTRAIPDIFLCQVTCVRRSCRLCSRSSASAVSHSIPELGWNVPRAHT